jgi:hypothetical protein
LAYAIEAGQFWSNLRLNECIIVVVPRLRLHYSMVTVTADVQAQHKGLGELRTLLAMGRTFQILYP